MHKHGTPILHVLLISAALLQGCATLISGTKQSVRITGQPVGSTVYVNDEPVRTTPVGDNSPDVKIKVKRNGIADIRVTHEGYKDYTETLYQNGFNPWGLLNVGLLAGSLAVELSSSVSYDVPESSSLMTPGMIGVAAGGVGTLVDYSTGAYLKLNKNEIKANMVRKPAMPAGSQSVQCTAMNVYIKGGDKVGNLLVAGKKMETLYFGKTVDTDSDHLKKILNGALKELGYTVPGSDGKSMFAGVAGTRYVVQGELRDIKYDILASESARKTVQFETVCAVEVTWKLLNRNRQLVFEQKASGEAHKFEQGGSAAFEDAFESAFYAFLSNDAVTTALTKSADTEQVERLSPLVLRRAALPSVTSSELSAAVRNVVTVETEDGHGSGCIITANGYIVTNAHVVDEANEVNVVLADGTTAKGLVVRINRGVDLALVKIDAEGLSAFQLPTASLADLGADVFAIGTPADKELGQTVTKGIISGRRKVEGNTVLQTDVSINPGNSGGALVTRSGQLAGIVNAKLIGRGIEGIGFAIPAERVAEALQLKFED